MRVAAVKLTNFRRFASLEIQDIPNTAKLVVLAGPNGSGKSSLFDAMLIRYRYDAQFGWMGDNAYYNRSEDPDADPGARVAIRTHENQPLTRGSVYIRTAYRHDPEFVTSALSRQGPILDNLHLNKLIETDATVAINYARLASQAMEDVFVREAASTTLGVYRDKLIGEVREPLERLFPGLRFTGVGNPLDSGTFKFEKGIAENFDYRNLSGGEKAAFDLILDFAIKRKSYPNAIYCIDEPETHMNTRVQGALLGELLTLLPQDSQLWIASHSIGMLRKARELYDAAPGSVVFLNFDGRDFDQPLIMRPEKPSRLFWQSVLHVALDDLASLVAPREIVICEGNPRGMVPGKNAEHDARVYSTIFSDEFPDVTFISAGSSSQVTSDFMALAATLPKVATGITVRRLIDLDDHGPDDVMDYGNENITVLTRRHLEAYLYDDEVLTALCVSLGKASEVSAVLSAKQQALEGSVQRGNAPDDIKSAAGTIYTETKRILRLTQVGNNAMAFARNVLSPLVSPDTDVYLQLRKDIFGT